MAKIYFDLIKMGLREIDQVPLVWRDKVQKMLDANSRDI